MNLQTPANFSSDHAHRLTPADCSRARLARDARFDGVFFVAVKTTGIFCRPVCPVVPPLEANVEYFDHAAKALQAGYRPCLRCRPDSAPGSNAWQGTDTSFQRALRLIDEGALQHASLPQLAERLGISDRYLRRLFQERLGLSPKAYALYGQVMFAKKLLHETSLPITDIALASGFNSLRRFNDAFVKLLFLAPTDIRRNRSANSQVQLTLSYRPPLNWPAMLAYWRKRCITGLEWVGDNAYGRQICLRDPHTNKLAKGRFTLTGQGEGEPLQLSVQLESPALLKTLIARVRRLLDLDADIYLIESHLAQVPGFAPLLTPGLRIPGIWHPFEAGVRAILGQQVSVAAARTHVERLVHALGDVEQKEGVDNYYFPEPQAVAESKLDMLKLPNSRRDTLKNFARWYHAQGEQSPVSDWLQLKGIGPWTLDYVRMRALGHTDVWLAGDLGIKKALANLEAVQGFDAELLKPWRSYATFHLWNV